MDKYRFKKDKWYKYNHSDGFYLKSSKDSEDTIHYSEYICISSNKHEYQNNYYKNKYVTDEEVPLEEVRKYLPEGHPDRFKKDLKLKENVWYQVTLSGKFKHVFKFIGYYRIGKVNLQGGHYDINGGKWRNASCFDFDSITDIKELSVEDIQQYLPENHPDKITTTKFEKGKWYKWYQKNHDSFHYGKFDSITDTTIIMKPWIMQCNSYKETGAFDINSVEQITEISYSDVEQFLPENMKETKEFPKYWFVKNNKQPELLEYAGYISGEKPLWWKSYSYIGYDGVPSCNGIHGCLKQRFINDAIEVSFEDFLENVYYVEFPEKRKQKPEFVLPEKWYTKPKTNEEKDVLNKFVVDLKDNHWKIEDKHSYEHTPHFKNGNYQRSTRIGYEDNDYTEITFEQFKKYVLKDKSVASTDKVKYVIATSEESVFVSSVVESVSISILNVEDSKILPLPKSIESVKTKLN